MFAVIISQYINMCLDYTLVKYGLIISNLIGLKIRKTCPDYCFLDFFFCVDAIMKL